MMVPSGIVNIVMGYQVLRPKSCNADFFQVDSKPNVCFFNNRALFPKPDASLISGAEANWVPNMTVNLEFIK